MKVRIYKAPHGRIDDIDIPMNPEDAEHVAALEARHIYPAIEVLRVASEYSLTLEADDLEEDLTCDVVSSDEVEEAIRAMVRAFNVVHYDQHSA